MNIAARAGGDIPQDQLFRHPAAQTAGDLLCQLLFGLIGLILIGQGDGHTARLPPGDDGDLMDRVGGGQLVDYHRVARLVVGSQLPGVLSDHPAALLRAGDHLQHGLVEVGHGNKPPVLPGGQQGRLIEQVLQIGPGKAGGGTGHILEHHILGQGLLAGVDL